MSAIRVSAARKAEADAARSAVRADLWQTTATIPNRVRTLLNSADVAAAQDAYGFDTDDGRSNELAAAYRNGDDTAALSLYGRHLRLIEGLARVHGTTPAFDEDDAHQEAVLALLESAKAETDVEFGDRVRLDIRSRVADESNRFRHAMPVSRRVWTRVKVYLFAANDNVEHAATLAAEADDPRERMSRESFFAAYHAIYGGRVDVDETTEGINPAENIVDHSAADDMAAVEGSAQTVDDMFDAARLTDHEAKIVRALAACVGEPPTHEHVAATLGISRPAVTKTYTKALRKLAAVVTR